MRLWPSGPTTDYFDNVMKNEFIVNNRTDAWKTDVNLFSTITNCPVLHSHLLKYCTNCKFMFLFTDWQWKLTSVLRNFCSYCKKVQYTLWNQTQYRHCMFPFAFMHVAIWLNKTTAVCREMLTPSVQNLVVWKVHNAIHQINHYPMDLASLKY